ncbi:MAG: VOC family protein [Bdellovibrionota bacterium]
MQAFELGFFSIPVTNMDVANAFYGNVMGWEFKERDPRFSYIFANGNVAGAIELADDQFEPSDNGPLMYFRADFMAKTLSRVNASGGTVISQVAVESGNRGYTARIQDPFKNSIGFWAPEN